MPPTVPDRPRDPGLQNERTALAWLRTNLALLGVALIVARITATQNLILALTLTTTAGTLSAWIGRSATRRYRTSARALAHQGMLPDGRVPALVAALTAVTGAFALSYVLKI